MTLHTHAKYKHGQHLFTCDVCGLVYYSESKRKRWDGAIVCSDDWEPRHPQDYVRGKKDEQSVPDARPLPGNKFLEVGDVDGETFTENATVEAKPAVVFLNVGDVTAEDI